MTARAEVLAQRAIDDGFRALVAHHEAAHVVAAVVLGVGPIIRVWVRPIYAGVRLASLSGRVEHDVRWPRSAEEMESVAIYYLAGDCGATGFSRHAQKSVGDREILEEVVKRTGFAIPPNAPSLAARLVSLFWPEVERVAAALLERGAVTGADVERLVREGA